MKIKSYVINLKDSTDRRERVMVELSKYPFMNYELVEAVDGRKMSQEDIDRQFDCRRFLLRTGRKVLPGEVGCTLSHRECYRKLLSSGDDIALILEDDVSFFSGEKEVEELLGTLAGRMIGKPCVITLTRHRYYYPWGEHSIGDYSLCRVREAWGTCAYLINRKAAAVLLNIGKPYFVADDFLIMNKKHIRVEGVFPMLAIGASEMYELPSLICEDWGAVRLEGVLQYFSILKYFSGKCKRLLCKMKILRKRSYGNEIIDMINQ